MAVGPGVGEEAPGAGAAIPTKAAGAIATTAVGVTPTAAGAIPAGVAGAIPDGLFRRLPHPPRLLHRLPAQPSSV